MSKKVISHQKGSTGGCWLAMYVYSFNTYPCIYIQYHYQHSIARAEARCSQTHQGAHCHRSRDQTASSSNVFPGRGSTGRRAAPLLQSPQNQPRPARILCAPAAPPPPAWRRASSICPGIWDKKIIGSRDCRFPNDFSSIIHHKFTR